MKVLLFVVFLCLAFGAFAQMGEPEPESEPEAEPENLSARIHELQVLVNKLEGAVKRFVRIGKANVGKLESVMNAVSERRRRCLTLETLRPAPIPHEPLPAIPLKPLTGPALSLSELSAVARGLEKSMDDIVAATSRYASIGKGNIGLMQRFAEASRTEVCGANHHSKCPMGFMHNAVSNSCFREVVGQFKTFSEAQEACHRRGGHLPKVENVEKNNALPGLLQPAVRSLSATDKVHALWLGLRRNAEGVWEWIHPEDSPVPLSPEDFSNFSTTEEDVALACVYLCTRSNGWVKASCEIQTRILCERPLNPPPAASAAK